MGTSLVVMREVWEVNLGNALVGDEMSGAIHFTSLAKLDLKRDDRNSELVAICGDLIRILLLHLAPNFLFVKLVRLQVCGRSLNWRGNL